MGSGEEGELNAYAEFREKVRRMVYIDCVSPAATVPILKTAIGQLGKVEAVSVVPNLLRTTEAGTATQSVLVVMKKEAQAMAVIEAINNLPFMICRMSRPVRALPAREEMFSDRPRNLDRQRIAVQWLNDPTDPEFAAAQRLWQIAGKHARERAALLQYQVEEEKKLEGRQRKVLRLNYDKFQLVDDIVQDSSLCRLTAH